VAFYTAAAGLDGWAPHWQVEYLQSLAHDWAAEDSQQNAGGSDREQQQQGKKVTVGRWRGGVHSVVIDSHGLPHAYVTAGSETVGQKIALWPGEVAAAEEAAQQSKNGKSA